MISKLGVMPENEVELKAFVKYINEDIKVQLDELGEQVTKNHATLEILQDFAYVMSKEDFDMAWGVTELPQEVHEAKAIASMKLEAQSKRLQIALDKEKEKFSDRLELLGSDVKEIQFLKEWDDVATNARRLQALDTDLDVAEEKAADLNRREILFGWEPTNYDEIKTLRKNFAPYFTLWTMCDDFQNKREVWTKGSFLKLDGETMEDEVQRWYATAHQLAKKFERISPGASEVARKLKKEITDFKVNLPIVKALASKALRSRHWDVLSETVGGDDFRIVPNDALTLEQLITADVSKYWDEIEKVTVKAQKEYRLEMALAGMKEEWNEFEFEIKDYKETKTFVLSLSDDIVTLLDDQIVKTQAMLGSPYIRPFLRLAKKWEERLQYVQSLLDEWLMCQRTWMYLEPIFSSPDILRQMPTEGRRFERVDRTWRKIMSIAKEDPSVMGIGRRDKLLGNFKENNKTLDLIQKGLADYLEIKRLVFPRFFFLSNDELLEILSQTKNPLAVQPHLSKCFEGINSGVFENYDDVNNPDLSITAMQSEKGETVKLIEDVFPCKGGNKGNVELWLNDLLRSMRLTVKDNVQKSLKTYVLRGSVSLLAHHMSSYHTHTHAHHTASLWKNV